MSTQAFDDMQPRDIAIAVAASNRIIIELLVSTGIKREKIESVYREKAGDLIGNKFEDNAANLLRMMSGTVRPGE